jgi:hypothetical protein
LTLVYFFLYPILAIVHVVILNLRACIRGNYAFYIHQDWTSSFEMNHHSHPNVLDFPTWAFNFRPMAMGLGSSFQAKQQGIILIVTAVELN